MAKQRLEFRDEGDLIAFAYGIADEINRVDPSADLRSALQHLLRQRDYSFSDRLFEHLVQVIEDRVAGFGPLASLVADASISDIVANAYDDIWVLRSHGWERVPVTFPSPTQFEEQIRFLISRANASLTIDRPIVDARLPNGGPRICATIPPASNESPSLSVRKYRPLALNLPQLMSNSPPSLSRDMAFFLDTCVRARLNILVAGGTGSGKTTLLSVLMGRIPKEERLVLIEDTPELSFAPPLEGPAIDRNFVRLLSDRAEGSARTPQEMLRASLRMSPDRIIVGEVRGGEALTMLQAMNTGHEGSMSSIHANTASDAISRLETLALMADTELPWRAIRGQIASAVHVIVQQERDPRTGHRYVSEIAEVTRENGEHIGVVPIFRHLESENWQVLNRPSFWSRLERHWPSTGIPFDLLPSPDEEPAA